MPQLILQISQALIIVVFSSITLALTPLLNLIKRKIHNEETRISQMNEILENFGKIVFELENQKNYLSSSVAFSNQHLETVKDYNNAISRFREKEYLYELWMKSNWPSKSHAQFLDILDVTKKIDAQLHVMNNMEVDVQAVETINKLIVLLKSQIREFISIP